MIPLSGLSLVTCSFVPPSGETVKCTKGQQVYHIASSLCLTYPGCRRSLHSGKKKKKKRLTAKSFINVLCRSGYSNIQRTQSGFDTNSCKISSARMPISLQQVALCYSYFSMTNLLAEVRGVRKAKRLCTQLQGKHSQPNSLSLHKSKHLGP